MFRTKGYSPNPLAMLLLLLCCTITSGTLASTQLESIQAEDAELDFFLPGIDEQTYQLSHLRGKIILVTFWASWCPQCIEEMPEIDAMWRAADQSRFQVLAINVGEEADMVVKFQQRLGLSFPLLLDQDMTIYKRWPLLGLPTSFLLNQHGTIVYKAVGYVDWSDAHVRRLIDSLIHEQ